MWMIPKFDFHIKNQTKRSLVETVDFVCGLGFGERREEIGLVTGRPSTIVSDLGVFTWNDQGDPVIESLHEGVSLEGVRANTGWEWPEYSPDKIALTTPPTPEELHLIRDVIDPLGVRRLDSKSAGADVWEEIISGEAELIKAARK
jgi:hypothetical protein